jgi:hypothetical protein
MKNTRFAFSALLLLWSASALASPLIEQWRGTGGDADKIFCKYGDGKISVIPGNQNCPASN